MTDFAGKWLTTFGPMELTQQEVIVVPPAVSFLAAEDRNPSRGEEGQLEDLPLLVRDVALLA